jgi:hypothetical protein
LAPPGIDTTLRLTLREGSIYYFTERSLTSREPHYLVVVNSDPLKQQLLLLGVCTSKVREAKERRKDFPETLVEISPQAFNILKKVSIIDCNDLKQVGLSEFNARFARKEIRYFDKDLPLSLRNALRKAIYASKIVPDEIKALVAKP